MHKRIAIVRTVGNPLPKGFYNSQEIGLAKGLSKLGFDVDIYMSGVSKIVDVNEIVTIGNGIVTVYELPCFIVPEISHAIFPGLIKELRKKNYDLIQVNEENEITSFWVAKYAKRNKIPCIVYQGMYEPLSGRIRATFQKLYDVCLLPAFRKNITHALTKTTQAKNHLIKKGFKKLSVIPVGLDTDAFQHSGYRNWRKDFSIPQSVNILLYIGIFEHRRNINFLLEIAIKLADSNYYLLLAGKGPIYQQIKNKITNEGIKNIILLGQVKQEHIKSLYELADFFLLASSYEIYGMVVLEALYSGCPVISTRTAGPEDLIKNGTHGYILDAMDVDLWADRILNNSIHFDRNSLKEYIEQEFTWDVIAQRYIDVALPDNS